MSSTDAGWMGNDRSCCDFCRTSDAALPAATRSNLLDDGEPVEVHPRPSAGALHHDPSVRVADVDHVRVKATVADCVVSACGILASAS
jgi:hypothetical protein